jgi:hypothetical protein
VIEHQRLARAGVDFQPFQMVGRTGRGADGNRDLLHGLHRALHRFEAMDAHDVVGVQRAGVDGQQFRTEAAVDQFGGGQAFECQLPAGDFAFGESGEVVLMVVDPEKYMGGRVVDGRQQHCADLM